MMAATADGAERRWQPVSLAQFGLFSACMTVFLLVVLCCERGFVFLLDGANLAFHEAGHLFIGFICPPLEVYGGTIGQLVFPVVLIIEFFRRGLPLSFAAGWIWFFENFFNIARYMADSRELVLPLVGGGGHDWNTIFDAWGILSYDTMIASSVIIAGWTGIALTWAWVGWRTWRSRNKPL